MLKRMKRPAHGADTLDRIQAWRKECPDLVLRSTFIVGFPGETEAEFEELLQWLDEAQLDRVGCFKYSPVEGATANALADHVPPEVQEERYGRFMERAAQISSQRLAAKVGRKMRVLVDAVEKNTAIARSEADAPEIDGVVRIQKGGKLQPKSVEAALSVLDHVDRVNVLGDMTLFEHVGRLRDAIKGLGTEARVSDAQITGLQDIKAALSSSIEEAVAAAEAKLSSVGKRKLKAAASEKGAA